MNHSTQLIQSARSNPITHSMMKCLVALLFTLQWLPSPALAQKNEDADVAAARERFRLGQERYAAGDYLHALEQFEAARLIKAVPAFDYNIAVCYERLNRPTEAAARFHAFIAETVDPAAIAEARQHLDKLEAKSDAPSAIPKGQSAPAIKRLDLTVSTPPEERRSYTAPATVGVGAVALAAIGAALLIPVAHEYDTVSASWDRQPTADLRAQADYLKTRAEASYAVFAVAGAVAIVDIVLWARAGRHPANKSEQSSNKKSSPSVALAPSQLGFTF